MQGNKSPGPNGMGPTFYKHFWGTIGTYVVIFIQSYFGGRRISHAISYTFIMSILKMTGVNKMEQFRTIALCIVLYNKVISKLLASRLELFLDLIIHSTQITFILNQTIMDNIIINHEV